VTTKTLSRVLFTFVLAAMLLVVPGYASANIIPIFISSTDIGGGQFRWDYDLRLAADQDILAGDFFTIYDFHTAVSASGPDATWFASIQSTGITPVGVTPPGGDDPAVPNVTFTYLGEPIPGPAEIFPFSIVALTDETALGGFTGQATLNSGGLAGTKSQNRGFVAVAGAADRVPEPTTMLLLGTGLIGVGLRLRGLRSGR
jgi:hypothetical protein